MIIYYKVHAHVSLDSTNEILCLAQQTYSKRRRSSGNGKLFQQKLSKMSKLV